MTITHDPTLDAREPADGDLETFENLSPGDEVSFFEWPVEPLTVIAREEDEQVGERVRVEAVGEESFLYEVDGRLWHYVEDQENREENPFPVQNLVLKDPVES
ncbi:hypothetical protein [Halobacterium salinarum]|uniref:hypothetical protein n=1 Tax=Halobacterium salinarum TaxID=2242 RepID=UPI0025526918|nr:hypothetical protein [Halobacterium salinarum]MDL0123498.1 hypothetical protein [Halobacterium salinarum]MDL0130396.1 hypothetical protein [Halobacterium salinarum]